MHLVAVVDTDLQAAHAAGHGTLWLTNAPCTAVESATPCTRTTRPCPAAGDAHALGADHLPWLPVPISRSQPCLCHHTGFLGSSMAPYSYPSSQRKQTGLMTPVTNGHARRRCNQTWSHSLFNRWHNIQQRPAQPTSSAPAPTNSPKGLSAPPAAAGPPSCWAHQDRWHRRNRAAAVRPILVVKVARGWLRAVILGTRTG